MSRQLLALLLVVPALAKLPDIFAELRPGEHGPMLQEGSTNAPLGVTYKPLAIGAYIIDNLQTVPGAQWPYNYYTIYYQKNMGGFNVSVSPAKLSADTIHVIALCNHSRFSTFITFG